MTEPLFGMDEVPVGGVGPAESALLEAVADGLERGTLVVEDKPLIAACRHTARAMDWAMRTPSPKAIYAVAQALTGYRESLHALRLPVAVAPAPVKLPVVPEKQGDPLSDFFGTPEP